MLHRCLIAVAVATALSAPAGGALAADLAVGPPAYAPGACATVSHAAPFWLKLGHRSDYVRIYDVTPYDPRCPAGAPAGVYVPPQAAYLVSSPTRYTKCDWPCSDSIHHDWYDGRLWYHDAGTPNRPDVFMILQKD